MKTKFICLAISLGLSGSVIAQHRHSNNAEIILGTALILGVTTAIAAANRQPDVIIQQAPQPIVEYRLQPPRLEPPVFDYTARVFVYKQPLAFNPRTGQWYRQLDVIVPEFRHYPGCNYYDYFEAERCMRWNESQGR